ncbi:unnamed protein product [Didymodactylos carnosus]|uniref:Ubiquitin-like domain-containing protein n=1 Tax=Didymodactylos carnosus TaxID=1234261 RepID=A0A8S2GUQ8_9BILA|nr:unnamed protein product [Didymodactylos carnosus]CAF3562157.1 unnamed protein product [Didymodactylos carnosus]
MYFLIQFTTTGERVIYNGKQGSTVADLLRWLEHRFHFESNCSEKTNRRLVLLYDNTPLKEEWYIDDLSIDSGATVKCTIREDKIPNYRFFLPIRGEMFDIYDDNLHPIDTTIIQMRIIASRKTGLPLSAFRLVVDNNNELFDHFTLSSYDIEPRSTLTIQTWVGWSDFYSYAIKGYTKAVLTLLSHDELVKQYMLQVALYISAHYGNARALINIGARADKPVGHHPSRQWCASLSKHPDYFRCPIHEAIESVQVGIVLLFGSVQSTILQKTDGYGISPWRLALRQQKSDPVLQSKHREIALFILTKQFGGIKLSKNVTITSKQMYALKSWADRAREKCYLRKGSQFSSLKKRPINVSGLLGYKLLIDGYNNDFCDFYSTAEYAKEKARTIYFIDDHEKLKAKQMENHLKSFNVLNTLYTKIAGQQRPGSRTGNTNTLYSGKTTGRKLWNKVSGIFRLETLLLRNVINLIEVGFISDGTGEQHNTILEEEDHILSIMDDVNAQISMQSIIPHNTPDQDRKQKTASSKPRSNSRITIFSPTKDIRSSAQSSTESAYIPIRIRLFTNRFRLIKEMMYKPDKDGRTLRHLSGNEWANVKQRENEWHTQRASTAAVQTAPVDPNIASLLAEKKKRKLEAESTAPRTRIINNKQKELEKTKKKVVARKKHKNRTSILPEVKEVKLLLPREAKKIDYRFVLRSDDKIRHELIGDWESSSTLSLSDLALQSMIEATAFTKKSWIKKVNLGIEFSLNQSKRTFE